MRLIDDPIKLKDARDQIINNNLSVRQTEKLVKKLKSTPSASPANSSLSKGKTDNTLSHEYCSALSNQLENKLNSRVSIIQNGSRGKIEIEYYSTDDLERVIGIFMNE